MDPRRVKQCVYDPLVAYNAKLECRTCKHFGEPQPVEWPTPEGGSGYVMRAICNYYPDDRISSNGQYMGCTVHSERKLTLHE